MSCTITNPQTVAYIANFITAQINRGYELTGMFVSIPDEFIKDVTENGKIKPQKIFLKLYALNYTAYETRYESDHIGLSSCLEYMNSFSEYDNNLHRPSTGKIEPWHWQMLKSIQFYLYQCSESEKLMNCTTYKTVKAFETALESMIINALPEYQAAEWE